MKMIHKTFDDRPSPHSDDAELLERCVVQTWRIIVMYWTKRD